MSIVFKAIKPSRLRQDAMRLAMLSLMHRVGREMKKDFEATQDTWQPEDKAKFDSLISMSGGGPTVLVGPNENGDVWTIVNNGAPPHDIPLEPKTDGFLVFQTGYKPKTVPGVIGSVQGGKFGGYTKRRSVHHPGHEGRKFTVAIQKKWLPKFKRMAEDTMREVAKKSGHGVR